MKLEESSLISTFFKGRAKQLFAAGFKTVADIASVRPDELTQQISPLNLKQAEAIVKAAKITITDNLETLQELVEEMKDVVKPSRKLNHRNSR